MVALIPAAILLTSACGADGRAGSPTPASSAADPLAGGFNATDVMFLQMMVAREADTARLIPLMQGRRLPQEVKTLAAAIETTQADESETMTAWLHAWKQPTAVDTQPSLHASHGGLSTLDAADLAALKRAGDTGFPVRFLNLLIAEQHNAVELARMETSTGINSAAKGLAHRIDESRTAQISAMLTLISKVPTSQA
jgi:uncharacterized protein (DUF305 family)